VQYIFFNLFSVPFSFSTIGLADQALDFTSIIKDAILSHLFVFVLFLIPLILLTIFHKYLDTNQYKKHTIIALLIMCITSYLSTYLTLIPKAKEDYSAFKLYYNIDDQISIIDKFGLITYTKIDIKRQLFGYESELIIDQAVKIKQEETTEEENEFEINSEEDLKNRILEYEKYKNMTEVFKELEEKRNDFYTKEPMPLKEFTDKTITNDGSVTLEDLINAFLSYQERINQVVHESC